MDDATFQRRTGLSPPDLQRLAALTLFTGLAADDIKRLLSDSTVRRFPGGTTLFIQGDPADRFFVVLDGWAKLFRETRDGNESVINVIGPGESFAEAAMFAQARFPVSCALLEDSRVLVVHGPAVLAELRRVPEISLNMLASMSRRLRGLVGHIEQLTTRSTTERVAAFLVHLSEADAGQAVVLLPQDKTLVAGRLGMRPETLSRSLARLRDYGVTSSGHEVMIENVSMLRDLSEGELND